MTERRRHARYELMAHVRVVDGEVVHLLDIRNLSLSGMYLSTADAEPAAPIVAGQSVEMDIFDLKDLENIRVHGSVTRVSREGDETGYGIVFTDLDGDAAIALGRLVELTRLASVVPPPLPQG